MTALPLPSPYEPFVDGTGKISDVWYRYLSQNSTLAAMTPDPVWTVAEQSADISMASNAVLANTSLTFPVAASTNYRARFGLIITCGATGGYQLNITAPAAPIAAVISSFGTDSAGSVSGGTVTSFPFAYNETTITSAFQLISIALQNGANAGNVTLQFAQQVSDGTASILRAPSWLEWSQA